MKQLCCQRRIDQSRTGGIGSPVYGGGATHGETGEFS
jgi:hypothetical protein